jgi:hypothetical protein
MYLIVCVKITVSQSLRSVSAWQHQNSRTMLILSDVNSFYTSQYNMAIYGAGGTVWHGPVRTMLLVFKPVGNNLQPEQFW